MASAKDIIVKPIKASAANDLVKRVHYSGKVVPNSQLHFGVFLNGKLEGAMSFGSPTVKKRVINLVTGTAWNGMIELNRMAFSELLPRNSESRALSVAFKIIRKNYPHIEWALSFSDGTQCGDGAIYRASGFVLTQIKKNTGQRIDSKTGEVFSQVTFYAHKPNQLQYFKSLARLDGYQFRYIYFINQDAKKRLTVPILPFSKIDEMGAGMYKGKPKRITKANSGDQSESGGAVPTDALQSQEVQL
jgi:hypothetical protein